MSKEAQNQTTPSKKNFTSTTNTIISELLIKEQPCHSLRTLFGNFSFPSKNKHFP